MNSDVVVPVRSGLFVLHPKRVEQLMNNNTHVHTAILFKSNLEYIS